MAPKTRTPDKNTLERWRDAGYTQAQMVEMTEKEFGNRVSRSAIAAAMVRYGLSEPVPRHDDFVPWPINPIHAVAQPLKCLRFMGRRHSGRSLNQRETDMLDSWLSQLAERNLIVAYDFDDSLGFYYISAEHKDHDGPAPIRKRQLNMAAVQTPGKDATRRKKSSK